MVKDSGAIATALPDSKWDANSFFSLPINETNVRQTWSLSCEMADAEDGAVVASTGSGLTSLESRGASVLFPQEPLLAR